jgi:hypothetical protein
MNACVSLCLKPGHDIDRVDAINKVWENINLPESVCRLYAEMFLNPICVRTAVSVITYLACNIFGTPRSISLESTARLNGALAGYSLDILHVVMGSAETSLS